jgi:hypothetical protein
MALEGLFIGAAAIQTLAGWRHSAELAILAMIGCSPDGPWEREYQGENCENTEDGYRVSAAGGKGRVLGASAFAPAADTRGGDGVETEPWRISRC